MSFMRRKENVKNIEAFEKWKTKEWPFKFMDDAITSAWKSCESLYESRKCEACKHKHARSVRMDGMEYTCDKMIRIGGIGFDNNFCCKYWEGRE